MKVFYLNILLAVVLITGIWGCKSKDKPSTKTDPSVILHSAAFSGLTDSIKREPQNPGLYLQRAARLSQKGFHQVATADFKKSWEITGDENIGMEYISNLLLTSHIAEAVSQLKDCQQKFPENTDFSRRLGEVYLQEGLPVKALDQYDQILSKDSSNFEAWYDKGSLLVKQKDTDGAIIAFERSFQLMPINYSGMALANLYVARKDPRALKICNVLLERDSAHVQTEPVFMKGVYFSDTKQYENAIRAFDTCIARDWKMTDAYIEKGIILYERKKFPDAMKIFNMAATVSNTDPDAYFWMGRCFEKTGDREQATTNYERAFSLDHSFSEASEALKRLNR